MKKLNIHALPTDDKRTSVWFDKLADANEFIVTLPKLGMRMWNATPHHIYLTDDSPIKNRSVCINTKTNEVFWYHEHTYSALQRRSKGLLKKKYLKKVVATSKEKVVGCSDKCHTDVELPQLIDGLCCHLYTMPSISQQDLPKIAELLNQGVTSVGVKRKQVKLFVKDGIEAMRQIEQGRDSSQITNDPNEIWEIKTKDGCIVLDWGEEIVSESEVYPKDVHKLIQRENGSIEKLKVKMYSREEVAQVIKDFAYNHDIDAIDKWIKDNLK